MAAPASLNTQDDSTEVDDWKPILSVLWGLVGSAAVVATLGTAVMYLRLDRIDVPPGPAVSLLPLDYRLVLGVRYLAVPVCLALMVFVVLLLRRPGTIDDRARSRYNKSPQGLRLALFGAGLIGLALLIFTQDVRRGGVVALVVASALFGVLIWLLVRQTEGISRARFIVFIGVLVAGASLLLIAEATSRPRFDMAALVRKDNKSAIGGFFLAKDDKHVLLIAQAQPGGQPGGVAGSSAAQLHVPGERCDDVPDPLRSVTNGADCYINQLVVIPADDVRKLTIGPRSQKVTAASYRAARRLAQLALLRGDEECVPSKAKKAAKKKGVQKTAKAKQQGAKPAATTRAQRAKARSARIKAAKARAKAAKKRKRVRACTNP